MQTKVFLSRFKGQDILEIYEVNAQGKKQAERPLFSFGQFKARLLMTHLQEISEFSGARVAVPPPEEKPVVVEAKPKRRRLSELAEESIPTERPKPKRSLPDLEPLAQQVLATLVVLNAKSFIPLSKLMGHRTEAREEILPALHDLVNRNKIEFRGNRVRLALSADVESDIF